MPDVILPVTAALLNVPTLVILGCADVVNVPVNKLAPIVPELAYTFPEVVLPVTAKLVSVPTLVILGWLFELAVNLPVMLANPPPTAAKLFENTLAGLISITKVWLDCVIIAAVPPLPPWPILNELVETWTHAIFAETITLPVGVLTCIPGPGVWFTDVTTPTAAASNSWSKLVCTFWNAVLIASAWGSSGNVPKSIFCWLITILPYLVFIVFI